MCMPIFAYLAKEHRWAVLRYFDIAVLFSYWYCRYFRSFQLLGGTRYFCKGLVKSNFARASSRVILQGFRLDQYFEAKEEWVFQTTFSKCFCFLKAIQSKSFSIISSVPFCVTVC